MSFVHGSLDVVVADPLINIPGEIFLLHPDQTRQVMSQCRGKVVTSPTHRTHWVVLSFLLGNVRGYGPTKMVISFSLWEWCVKCIDKDHLCAHNKCMVCLPILQKGLEDTVNLNHELRREN